MFCGVGLNSSGSSFNTQALMASTDFWFEPSRFHTEIKCELKRMPMETPQMSSPVSLKVSGM